MNINQDPYDTQPPHDNQQNIKFDKFKEKKEISQLNYLNLSFPETSLLANNTKNKILTIAEEFPHLDLASRSDARAYDVKVNYLTRKDIKSKLVSLDSAQIDNLVKYEILEKKQIKIMAYKKEEVQKLFNFNENGFTFDTLSQDAKTKLSALGNQYRSLVQSIANFYPLGDDLEIILESWATEQGLIKGVDYDQIIALGGAYRDQLRANTFPLSHVDFQKDDTSAFMSALSPIWKGRVAEKLKNPALTDQEYRNVKIANMVNVWMPLNDKPTKNTLAVMDTSRLQKEDLYPVRSKVGPLDVTTMLVHNSYKQQYVIQSDMKFGDMVIFETLNTPHTAVDVDRPEADPNEPRKSIEMRVIFIKEPNSL